MNFRYKPEVGDIVIGRVVEVNSYYVVLTVSLKLFENVPCLLLFFCFRYLSDCCVGCSEALEIGYKLQSTFFFDAFFYEYA